MVTDTMSQRGSTSARRERPIRACGSGRAGVAIPNALRTRRAWRRPRPVDHHVRSLGGRGDAPPVRLATRSRLRAVPASTLICPTIRTCLLPDPAGRRSQIPVRCASCPPPGLRRALRRTYGSGVPRLDGSGCGKRFGASNYWRVGDRRSRDGRPVDRDPGNPLARPDPRSAAHDRRGLTMGPVAAVAISRGFGAGADAIPPVEAERRILIRRKFRSRAELSLVAGELPLAPTIANLQMCRIAGVSRDRAVSRSLPARTGPRTHRGSEPPRRLGGCGPHARHGWSRCGSC